MIKSGKMSQRTIGSCNKIPRRTLNYKLKDKHMQKTGKLTIFIVEEEKTLVWCTIQMSDFGFPIDSIDVRHTVKEYLQSKGRTGRVEKQYAR
jgi:hypothetical protein